MNIGSRRLRSSTEYPEARLDIYQGTCDAVYHWLKDRLVCVISKGFRTKNPGYVAVFHETAEKLEKLL